MNIIAKYSDYTINSIEYFIEKIENDLLLRDLPGLFKNKVEIINVTKQHPLVQLVSSRINEDSRTSDLLRSGILPAISVTPGSTMSEGFTLGQSYTSKIVDSEFINILKSFQDKSEKEIIKDVLITKKQIEDIISAYNRLDSKNNMRYQNNEWHKKEELNISVWSEHNDITNILTNLMDSILAGIQVDIVGNDSRMRNMEYKITEGLTNFNFGRTLFGSEYSLTFLNTYSNYILYTDIELTNHDLIGSYTIPGEQ